MRFLYLVLATLFGQAWGSTALLMCAGDSKHGLYAFLLWVLAGIVFIPSVLRSLDH